VIETERLRLRRFTAEDAGHLVALNSDPEVVRYADPRYVDHPPDLAEVRERMLPGILAADAESAGAGFWAAEERADGRFLAWFFLRPIPEEPGTMELGYRLVRRAWGRGLAVEGARALLVRAAELGAGRVIADIDPANTRSIRVAEKAGLRLVGPVLLDGVEELRYAIDVQTVFVSR
jgi:RimJ/RimL family protein N-acetyltransferase